MNHYIPQIGDVVRINCGLYQHVGVYVGPQPGNHKDIVHNDKSEGVISSTLAEFSDGAPVFLHRQAIGNWLLRRRIANRAINLIGKKYDLWNFNCEHAASLAQTGNPESPQLAGLVIAGLLALGLMVAARKK